MKADAVKPFLRWVGGKQQLLKHILPRLPERIDGPFYVPFCGGGAVPLAMRAAQRLQGPVLLSDASARLMATYVAVRDHLPALIAKLDGREDTEPAYIEAKQMLNSIDPLADLVRTGALMIYLNKTGFNGLYRENSRGEMNTPYGHSGKHSERRSRGSICNVPVLTAASKALQGVTLSWMDFRQALYNATAEGLAYLDPPYVPVKPTSFVGYVAQNEDVIQLNRALAAECRRLNGIGFRFLLSNADMPLVHELYDGFTIERVAARRMVNSDPTGRGPVGELLIRNY
jgi:DNA adenine methylase